MHPVRCLILSGLVILPLCLVAQTSPIPNAGFENWSAGNPVSWLTTNVPGIAVSVTQTAAAHSGSSAVQGTAVLSNATIFAPILQSFFPVNASYGTCTGWFTFAPVGGDVLAVSLFIWKQESPIGAGSFETGAAVASHTQFSFPVEYFLPGPADSAWLFISITSSGDVHAGSTFTIDDIALSNPTGVVSSDVVPGSYALLQNYPNPFNPSTMIRFDLPTRSAVRLSVLNMLGQEVDEIVAGEMKAGSQSVTWGSGLPSGVYFYRLQARSLDTPGQAFSQTRRMVLLR